MKFLCPFCTQRIELCAGPDDTVQGLRVDCPTCSQSFEIPAPPPSPDWLDHLTAAERALWDSKPQVVKDWWFAYTDPGERKHILQEEISNLASGNE